MLKLEKRPSPSTFWTWAAPVVAVVLTMLAGGLMFAMLGKNPVAAIKAIFWDPLFGDLAFYYRGQLLVKAAPTILIAVGLSLGFRAGIWNIGAEGQYIMGAIVGGGVGLAFYPAEHWFIFPLCILAGAFGGWFWAMIPAVLKVKFNTNEILVSLLLVYVAQIFLASMSMGLLKNPQGMGFPGSRNLAQYPATSNPELIAGTGAHWGVVAAALAVLLAWILLEKHLTGFQIKLAGLAPRAARYAGVSPARLIILCMGISGALAGMAGFFEVAGPAGQLKTGFDVGYGFSAIIVAFLGRLNPIGILLAGLLMALTYVGGENAAQVLQLPSAAIKAFQGMLLFFLLGVDMFTNYRLKLVTRRAA